MSLDIYVSSPKCPHCGADEHDNVNINITYNLSKTWRAAGFDDAACDGGLAVAIIPNVRESLATLKADPDRFRSMNPSNGWGTYEGLIDALQRLLEACERHPNATMSTWR